MPERHLTIVWLYHDLMNLYGDRGNVLVLAHRARARGVSVRVIGCSLGEELPQDADIVFFGGGQDQEQVLVAKDLPHKRDRLEKLIARGGGVLAICGGYQLLGAYYDPLDGARIAGLGLLPVYTRASTRRMINDLLVSSSWGELIGFENHSGQTFLTGGQPLGHVVIGSGNNGDDKTEGVRLKNAIGSYLHGPLLPKNPVVADWLIAAGLTSHGDMAPLAPLVDGAIEGARRQAIERATTRRTSSLGMRS